MVEGGEGRLSLNTPREGCGRALPTPTHSPIRSDLVPPDRNGSNSTALAKAAIGKPRRTSSALTRPDLAPVWGAVNVLKRCSMPNQMSRAHLPSGSDCGANIREDSSGMLPSISRHSWSGAVTYSITRPVNRNRPALMG